MSKKHNRPLSAEELAKMPDSEIDYSDIPELDAEFWSNAVLSPPKAKSQISLRVPDDVVDFFKAHNPKGYTTKMAAVLSAYAKAHKPE
jgi:uncharacterized protein (DUF4415 family)